MAENKKKSIIKKAIYRKIRTADYEQLDVNVEIEEEIEWVDVKERDEETKKITEKLISDFTKTYNSACEVLDVGRCIGTVTTPSIKAKKKKKVDKENKSEESYDSLDFLEEKV